MEATSVGYPYNASATERADLPPYGLPSLVIQLWKSRRQRGQEFKQLFESDWIQYWRWYRNYVRPMSDPADWWRSNEAIPTSFKIIETILPRYIVGMFENPQWFSVEARQRRDEQYEHLAEALLRASVEDMDLFPKLYEAMKYTLIMGHCWGKVIWREEYATRQVMVPTQIMDPFTGEPMIGVSPDVVTEEIFNGVDFEWRPLDRIFPDPTGEGEWYVEEIDTTMERLDEVQELLGVYDDDEITKLRSSIPPHRGPFIGDSLSEHRQGTSGGINVEYAREPESTEGIPLHYVSPMREGTGIKLWQCWGYVPKQYRGKDGSAWRLTVIANNRYLLRDEPAPTPDGKPPYFPMKAVPIPGRLYGESPLKYIGPLNDQQTRLSNMRIDEVFLGVWQQYLYRRNAVVSDNQLLMQPGGAIEVVTEPGQSITDAFTVLPRKPVMPEAYQEDQYRQTQAEHAAAASDIMQGVSSTDRQTATEIERRLQQGNARHVLQTLWNENTITKELLKRTWQWLQMRLTQPKLVRIAGEEYALVDLAQIQIPIDIVVGGGMTALSKETRIQMDQELVQLSTSPVFSMYMRPDAILRRLLMDRGWKNPDMFIKTEQEVMLAQLAAQMGQMEAAGGGAGGGEEAPGGQGTAATSPDQLAAQVPQLLGPGAGANMAAGNAQGAGAPVGIG